MPIFCQKNVHSHKNTLLSYHFFSIFHEKPPIVMPQFGQKTAILTKLLYIMGEKSQQDPFFPDFYEKITVLMTIFCQKDVHSLKNIFLSCPYCVEKKSILSKTPFSRVFFFNFTWKTPCCHAHIWSNNVNSVKTTLYYVSKKSIQCPFFSIFSRKN